jgi:hypothetical protein
VLRIERSFRVRLPVTEVAEMESVADLLKALEHAAPGGMTAHGTGCRRACRNAADRPARSRQDLDRDARLACREHPDHIHVTVLQDENTVLGTMSYATCRPPRARSRKG